MCAHCSRDVRRTAQSFLVNGHALYVHGAPAFVQQSKGPGGSLCSTAPPFSFFFCPFRGTKEGGRGRLWAPGKLDPFSFSAKRATGVALAARYSFCHSGDHSAPPFRWLYVGVFTDGGEVPANSGFWGCSCLSPKARARVQSREAASCVCWWKGAC